LINSQPQVAFETQSAEHTQTLGERIGRLARPGDVILLNGGLGAGKTSLTRGIARGLGIEETVQSPTFVLARELMGNIPLYHIDLYRLDSLAEIADLGLDEYFYGQGLTVVEWADKGTHLLPEDNLSIKIEIKGENIRIFSLVPSNAHYQKMVSALTLQK